MGGMTTEYWFRNFVVDEKCELQKETYEKQLLKNDSEKTLLSARNNVWNSDKISIL